MDSQNQHAGMRITAFSIDHAFGYLINIHLTITTIE